MGALSVVICAILSSLFLNEKLSFFGWLGCALCVVCSSTPVSPHTITSSRQLGSVIIALNGTAPSASHSEFCQLNYGMFLRTARTVYRPNRGVPEVVLVSWFLGLWRHPDCFVFGDRILLCTEVRANFSTRASAYRKGQVWKEEHAVVYHGL